MNTKWLKARQTKYVVYLTVYVAIALAVVTVANIVAKDKVHWQHDYTGNKRYSLSDQTLKVIRGLKEDATITYFDNTSRFREGSPSPKDLLDRYANVSSKVHVQFIDPDTKPDLTRAAGVKSYATTVVQV